MHRLYLILALAALLAARPSHAARNVPPPRECTPQVNARLAEVVAAAGRYDVDNVMVCGITVSSSHRQRAGRHGAHEILPLLVKFPDGGEHLVEVVINDDLDGVITAPARASVFAYGQAFVPDRGHFAAGIHDVHCATHRGADNGWVVVNGERSPRNCP
ncbi:MAG TPA: hypothetical protein VGR96_06665 [Acidobacteriaceae bacterium]|nr:hypothetical protein [Acidobacteriaceae bacterium]